LFLNQALSIDSTYLREALIRNVTWRLVVPGVVASFLACSAGGGQQNPAEPSKIKASTELVVVPVIVHKGGAHLGGLKKENSSY
jgi:hypothetical protein